MDYSRVSETLNPTRTADGLLRLRDGLMQSGVPTRTQGRLLMATWNIREFDSPAYGPRSLECLHYIAEICRHFDVIAVQEVREKLDALKQVVELMGGGWTYIVSDVTAGTPGNRERMAFVYDKNKVEFTGFAGEVVIPPKEIKKDGKIIRYDPSDQLYRTPFLVGFKSGWTTVWLCTVHILYGEDEADNPDRTREIKLIAEFLAGRSNDAMIEDANMVLLGDFNIYKPTDVTMTAMTDAGFVVPPELQSVPATNTGTKKRHYDQIAIMPQLWRMETTGRAGVFNFFEHVYRDTPEDQAIYAPEIGPAYTTKKDGKPRTDRQKRTYYRTYWRTHQMSDHLPMWLEIKTDFGEDYLHEFASV